jgi:hypothetical protein
MDALAHIEGRPAIQAQGAELGSRIDALTARMDEHLGRHAG